MKQTWTPLNGDTISVRIDGEIDGAPEDIVMADMDQRFQNATEYATAEFMKAQLSNHGPATCELTTKEFLRVVQGRPDPVQESPNVFRPWYTLTEQPDVFDLSEMD